MGHGRFTLVQFNDEHKAFRREPVSARPDRAEEHDDQICGHLVRHRRDPCRIQTGSPGHPEIRPPQAQTQTEESLAADLTVRSMTLRKTLVIGV